MPHLFIILLKINLVLVLFAASYYLVLRKLTFYVLNRAFLLFGILFSTCYPFINLTALLNGQKGIPEFVPGLNQNVSGLVHITPVSLMWQLINLIFYAGVVFMAIRLAIQFLSLYRVHRKSRPAVVENSKVRVLKEELSPFSFWQTIYINPDLHAADELNHILAHEKVHVKEWHTIDIILSEISVVFYWFNPGVWLMKKAIRENIEFITDAEIIKKGIDKKAYQYSLLGVGALQHSVAIVNNFNLSDLRKRIVMMNLKRSSNINLTRYFLALTLLLCITLAFTIDKKNVDKTIRPISRMVKQVLPEVEKTVVIKHPAPVKKQTRKNASPHHKQPIDSLQKFSFVFNTSFDTVDSSRQSMAHEMQKLAGKAIKFKMNSVSNVSVHQFTFKDTLKLNPTLMTVAVSDQQGGAPGDKATKPVRKMIFIKTISKTSDSGTSNLVKSGSSAEMDFYLNGKKVEKEDVRGIDVNQIADIQLLKNNTSSIYINTKP